MLFGKYADIKDGTLKEEFEEMAYAIRILWAKIDGRVRSKNFKVAYDSLNVIMEFLFLLDGWKCA